MRIKIKKWGKSLTLRISKTFAYQLKIRQDEKDNKITVESKEVKQYTLEELIAGINKSNLHYEIDLGKREGNEYW